MPDINWSFSVPDLLAAVGVGFLLYGRLVSLETKVEPIWKWWSDRHMNGNGGRVYTETRRTDKEGMGT